MQKIYTSACTKLKYLYEKIIQEFCHALGRKQIATMHKTKHKSNNLYNYAKISYGFVGLQ